MMKEGVDWGSEEQSREKEHGFENLYSEHHIKTERIKEAPKDGEVYGESGQEAKIQSDGERGRLETLSHKELIRCDCGCIVDDIKKTRKDKNGQVFCERHANLLCRLCSNMIQPSEIVKINESLYHRRCARKVVDRILDEAAKKPGGVSPLILGELKSIKEELFRERLSQDWKKAKEFAKRLFKSRKNEEKILLK